LGVEEIIMGMPHRGRLNVLCNLLEYPYGDLVRKIQGLNDMPIEYY
jgi:probable 2-oxoglutarate dehydrogenase E1 component DHKTD1